MKTRTHYVKSGDVHIAYQVVGDGPIDLITVPGFVSHLEYLWQLPAGARLLVASKYPRTLVDVA